MRTSIFGLAIAIAATMFAHAETPQETFDKNLKNAQEVAKSQEAARQRAERVHVREVQAARSVGHRDREAIRLVGGE